MQVTMSFNNVTVVFVNGNDYIIHFWYMSKDEAINIMKKPEWKEKSGTVKNQKVFLDIYKNG